MKDLIIGVLVLILIVNTIFIYCCIKVNSEVENVHNKPSKNRKTKTNK